MFVNGISHINDTTAFIAVMKEKTVRINHDRANGWFFVYPGSRQVEGSYAFSGDEIDYGDLINMLHSCGKEVIIVEK